MGTDGTGRRRVAADLTVEGEVCRDNWSPDSRFLVTGADVAGGSKGRIVVIDIASGKARIRYPGHDPGWMSDLVTGRHLDRLHDIRRVLERVRPDGTGPDKHCHASRRRYVLVETTAGSTGRTLTAEAFSRTNVDTRARQKQSVTRDLARRTPPPFRRTALNWPSSTRSRENQAYDLYLCGPDGTDARRLASDVAHFRRVVCRWAISALGLGTAERYLAKRVAWLLSGRTAASVGSCGQSIIRVGWQTTRASGTSAGAIPAIVGACGECRAERA